jgi:hypothetical protein
MRATTERESLKTTSQQGDREDWEENIHLHICCLDIGARRPGHGKVGGGDNGGYHECDGREEAEDILEARKRVVHDCDGCALLSPLNSAVQWRSSFVSRIM